MPWLEQFQNQIKGPFLVNRTDTVTNPLDTRGGGLAGLAKTVRLVGENLGALYDGEGLLIPRYSTADRNALTGLVGGELIFNTDTLGFEFWSGVAWVALNGAPAADGGIYVGVNTILVDPTHPLAADDANLTTPFLTLTGAFAAMGSAATAVEFNVVSDRYYRILVAPGVYNESPAVPVRPFIELDISSALIVGDLTQTFPAGWANGALKGSVLRIVGGGLVNSTGPIPNPIANTGIVGNVGIVGNANTNRLVLVGTSVSGDVQVSTSGPAFNAELWAQGSEIGSLTAGAGVDLQARLWGSDAVGMNVGAVTGPVSLARLAGVRFTTVITPEGAGGDWSDVSFAAGSDFTNYTGNVLGDPATWTSFFAGVAPAAQGAFLTKTRTASQLGVEPLAGPTADRPADPATGLSYFDTTLGLPIWWSGGTWIDAAGNNV